MLIFFICFEIVLIFTSPKPKYERANEFMFYEYDEYLGWKNKPNATGFFYMPDRRSYVKINSKGLRDAEHNYSQITKKSFSKPPKKSLKRIQFYGDSFTWGYGLDAGERYTEIFADKIEENSPNKFEIMNFGTTGYGTDQEYLLLKNEGLKYNPSIVIFAYHNDAFDVSRNIAYNHDKPFFSIENNTLVLTNYPVPKRENLTEVKDLKGGNLIVFLDSKLGLLKSYVFIREKTRSFKPISNFKDKMFLKDMNSTFQVIDKLLIESKNSAERNNASFIVVLLPDKYQVYGNANTIEIEHILKLGEEENLSVINLLPELKEIGKEEKDLFFVIDHHYSKNGNKIIGELLYKELKTREFI